MLPRNHPDRIKIAFDDHRLVANAGLLLPATLALHLGLSQLVQQRLDLGVAPGRANTGDKIMTLVASALAGGDCIDDADALRAGGTAGVLDCLVKAPSGTFLRSFRWGHVRQLDEPRVAGPGLGGWGRRRRTLDYRPRFHHLRDLRTGQGRGAPPRLHRQAGLSPTAGHRRRNRRRADGPLREGRANTARGAAHFLRETVIRYGGARGQLTVRADSGFYAHSVVSVCRKMDSASPSPSASTKACTMSSRPYLKMPGRRSLLDGRRRRCGRDHLYPIPARRRAGAAHRPAGEAHARFPVGPLRHLQLSRLTAMGRCGTGGRSSRPDRECDTRPQVRCRTGRPAASPPTAPGWRYR